MAVSAAGPLRPQLPVCCPRSIIVLYHLIAWGLAALLGAEGLLMLYHPSLSR